MNVIWSKDKCIFCDMAKDKLKKLSISFEERNINKEWTKDDMLSMVPNAKTVPQIFINGVYVGGYTDLMAYLNG
jgi:glutaredoxin 3